MATCDTGWTALQFAAVAGATRNVSQLLEAGANSEARNEVGSR